MRPLRLIALTAAIAACLVMPSAAGAELKLGVHQNAPLNPDNNARAARALDSTGALSVRAQIDWATVQPTRGLPASDWNWKELDDWFRALAQSGTGATPATVTTDGVGPDFVTLIGTPNWAASSNCRASAKICIPGPNFRDEWKLFVRQAVLRYGIGGSFWETEGLTGFAVRNWGVWNEPNADDKWNGDANPQQYRDLLEQTRDAIKNVGSAHEVLGVNLAYRDGPEPPSWMTTLMRDTNAKNLMDKVGVHFYLARPDMVVPAARRIRDLGATNIAITEMGWSVGSPEGRKCVATVRKQADNLRAAIREVRNDAPIVSWLFWFNGIDKDSNDQCVDGEPQGARFGLFREFPADEQAPLAPKCAFYEYRALATPIPAPACP